MEKEGFTLLPELFPFLLCVAWPAWAQQEEIPSQGKPLTLEQCTAMALKYHPSLRASQATIEGSKARVEQALANYYPQVNLTAVITPPLPISLPYPHPFQGRWAAILGHFMIFILPASPSTRIFTTLVARPIMSKSTGKM